jgi:transmembrane sensor
MITDDLLIRYLNGETSPKECRRIEKWQAGDPGNASRIKELLEYLKVDEQTASDPMVNKQWNELVARMSSETPRIIRHPVITLHRIRIAAVLAVVLASGFLLLRQKDNHIIRNRENITKCVFLPDGTQVDLGPLSKLTFENDFLDGKRMVTLSGEAFFDVTSDPDHPFTVVAGSAKIRVTGTKFFVNATPRSDEVEVTVRSGKVLFYNSEILNKNSFRMGLAAGEKGIFYPALNRMDKTSDPYFHSAP